MADAAKAAPVAAQSPDWLKHLKTLEHDNSYRTGVTTIQSLPGTMTYNANTLTTAGIR